MNRTSRYIYLTTVQPPDNPRLIRVYVQLLHLRKRPILPFLVRLQLVFDVGRIDDYPFESHADNFIILMAAGNLTDVTQAAQDKNQVLSHTKNPSNKRVRHPPTLATALFDVKEAKGAGYGVFATQDIPSQTELLVSSSPSAYAIYRTFRKEVCAWCFKYERGRNWKVKLTTPARDDGDRPAVALNGGGMVFCSDDCRNAWYNEYGDVALEAYNALESYIQRQGRKESWNSGSQDQGIDQFSVLPSEEEVDKVCLDVPFCHFSIPSDCGRSRLCES